jgi:hypothetical protein
MEKLLLREILRPPPHTHTMGEHTNKTKSKSKQTSKYQQNRKQRALADVTRYLVTPMRRHLGRQTMEKLSYLDSLGSVTWLDIWRNYP